MANFGGDYFSKYAHDLIDSATSKARAAARNEVNKSESAAFDPSSLTTTVGDTVKDPTTGEYTKEVTITQKKDAPETPAPNDKILGMNKYVVIGGGLAVVILGGFLVYELTKTNK